MAKKIASKAATKPATKAVTDDAPLADELAVEQSAKATSNLTLWNSVEKTPPGVTKPVSYGKRKYTVVDPQWQMRVATALWGPYGGRWALRNLNYQVVPVEDIAADGPFTATAMILHAEFHFPNLDLDETFSFPIINDMRFKVGDDTAKKLITNTRSKALSWLGFSADVFLGKFDDVGYVKDLGVKFGNQNALVTKVMASVETADTLEKITACRARLQELIANKTFDDRATAAELFEMIGQREQEIIHGE